MINNVRYHKDCKHTFDGADVTPRRRAASTPSSRRGGRPPKHLPPAVTANASALAAKSDQRLQIAVMIRSDVFRTDRRINVVPSPKDFFRVVNDTVAQHLAVVPVALPDLTEVLAEVARTDSASGCPDSRQSGQQP